MSYKWIRNNVDLTAINEELDTTVVKNSGVLENDFHNYAANFLTAGNLILHSLIKNGKIAELDTWYFALVYVYRQSLELLLKANIFLLEKDITNRKTIIGNVRHDLSQAFDEILRLSGINITGNDNAVWLKSFLEDIARIDSSSDMFRYPFGQDLSVVFEEQTHVDLVATYYNFNRAFDLLAGFYINGQFQKEDYSEEVCYDPKLIVEGGEYLGQSVVGYKYNQRSFYPYFTSYQECGKFLADYIINTLDDSVFMPMCYMFRNALELGIKRLIIEGSHLETQKALKVLKRKKHSIKGLWNSIVDEITSYANGNDLNTLAEATKYIDVFHEYDLTSDKFRYPCNKEMEPYFTDETTLDVKNISDCFIELCNFLDAVDSMMIHIKDSEAEIALQEKLYEEELEQEYQSYHF